jgi:hypothetical protein
MNGRINFSVNLRIFMGLGDVLRIREYLMDLLIVCAIAEYLCNCGLSAQFADF